MAADRELKLNLIADVASATKSINNLDKTFTSFGGRVKAIGADIGARFNAFAIDLAGDALRAGLDFLQQGVQDAIALEEATAKLGLTLRNVGAAVPTKQLAEWVQQMETATNISDIELTGALNGLIVQMDGVRAAQRILNLAFDVAAAKGISLEAAIKLVTGAYNGSSKAARLLGTDGKEGWKAIGDAERTFAGSNEKNMDSITQRWASVSRAIEDIGVAFGQLLLPAIEPLSRVLKDDLVPALDAFAEWVESDVATGIGELAEKLVPLTDGLRTLADGLASVGALGAIFSEAMSLITGPLQGLGTVVQEAADVVDAVMTGDLPDAFHHGLSLAAEVIRVGMGLVLAPLRIGIDAIKAIFKAFGIDLDKVFEDVMKALRDLAREAGDLAFKVGKAIVDGILDGLAGLGDLVADVLDEVRQQIQNLLDFIADPFTADAPDGGFGGGSSGGGNGPGGGGFMAPTAGTVMVNQYISADAALVEASTISALRRFGGSNGGRLRLNRVRGI